MPSTLLPSGLIEKLMMEFRAYNSEDTTAIEQLFRSVFTASEGEREGIMLGNLVKELMATTENQDLFGFVAVDDEQLVGVIFFSRLTFEVDVNVFILSPVAVQTAHQGKGIGRGLILHGLQEIHQQGVEFVITYGAPDFYSQVGFHSISQDSIQPPFQLSQPQGWLGLSLTDEPIETISGHCSCVTALNKSEYW